MPVILCLCLACVGAQVCAQNTDLARIEYTYIPQVDSENSVSRFRALINVPFQLNWEGSYLIAGFEYRNLDLDFEDPVPFETQNLDRFQLFRTSLSYTFKMKKNWRFAAKVGAEVNSNFENDKITNRDINVTGAVFMIRDRSGDSISKPDRLILGLNYSTTAGRPFPIPIVNYYKKFHPNWSYSVGTPKTNLKYTAGKKHALQGFVTLDGFFSNIQNNLNVPNSDGSSSLAENISMTLVFGGVGYEYYFTKHLLFYLYGGHTFFNEIRLRDGKRNSLYKINEANTYYLRSGIKFKL
ncbi:MAG: hypothetical protein KTR22_07535 [Flavobacteriaceae bacterium]|nr:hypothetical protein [Flavobacteriaceae bacterium]